MSRDTYTLTTAHKSYCPQCSKTVTLLAVLEVITKPAFYVCFDCERIGQVGVGPVEDQRK